MAAQRSGGSQAFPGATAARWSTPAAGGRLLLVFLRSDSASMLIATTVRSELTPTRYTQPELAQRERVLAALASKTRAIPLKCSAGSAFS
jgi:hypothetical protein